MEMSIEDKIAACREFRHKGNLFHGEGQYRRAALQYRQVAQSLVSVAVCLIYSQTPVVCLKLP